MSEADQFARIELTAKIEKTRSLLAQYEEGLTFFRAEIEQDMHKLGRLDERLGGRP